MKVLIIRFSSIGDIVLTTPVIRGLKVQTQATVHYATKERYISIVDTNPYVDRVHVLKGSLSALIAELKKEKFDYVVDLHHNLRTRIIKSALGVPAYSFDKLNIEKWLIVNLKVNRLPEKHIVDRYLETVAPLGVVNDDLGLDYFIPAESEISPEDLPAPHRDGYAAYAIGGQHATKKLPLEKIIELCSRLAYPLVLLGGKEDFEIGESVRSHFEQQKNIATAIFNACGKYNLHQSASFLKKAKYVVTHDTGLMHIAAAFKKNIFAIWGNTIPGFGMYPYRAPHNNIENLSLSCRPCSKIGYEKCPKGHFKCMRDLSFDEIASTVDQ